MVSSLYMVKKVTKLPKLKELRLALKLSQKEFAQILQVNHSSIARYEAGTRRLSYEKALLILNFASTIEFAIELEDLIIIPRI